MRKVWLVFKREYLTRIRTKGFVISTVALPVLTIGAFIFSVMMATRQADRTLKIAILDTAGGFANLIAKGLDRKLPNGQPAFRIVATQERPAREDRLRSDLQDQVRRGQLDGFLVISSSVLDGKDAEFHTKNVGDLAPTFAIRRAVNNAVITRRLSDRGIQLDNLSETVRGVDLKLVKVTEEGETEEKGQTVLLSVFMMFLLYMTLVIYGVQTMRSVLEEKTTRIVEILVSSIPPSRLLVGKILGVAGVGVTQYLIWAVTGGLLSAYGSVVARAFSPTGNIPRAHVPWLSLFYLIVFFLGGYFLYASLYAAIGAIASSDEEAQQLQVPVTLPIVIPAFLMQVVLRNPNSTVSTVLSLVPFFAPVLMVVRIGLQAPPFWQIAASLFLLALTTLVVVYLSAKIYRVGVLMYGKRPSLVEVARWLRYT